ncbi:Hypothetical predicted protein [Mytilus galloprovincialis]|uniref:Uncharacterized protein n=1 Tax=Mytilus galloprovincialis TaxID=29158 RepID=A0A8B6GFC7_MYTGA|nr:Hypothetical predicted protein [Mytilus galloprovincialis]
MPETPGKQSSTTETPKSKKKIKLKCKEQDTNTCETPKKGKKLRFSEDEDEIQLISPSVSPKSTCRLPMKKRKLATNAKSTNHTPWVASLNREHKLMLKNNSWLCSEIINVSMNIIAKQFPLLSGLQPTGLAPLFDEDKQCWTEYFGTFISQDTPCVQIHHTGKSHWITSHIGQDNIIAHQRWGYYTTRLEELLSVIEPELSFFFRNRKQMAAKIYVNDSLDLQVLLPRKRKRKRVLKENNSVAHRNRILKHTCALEMLPNGSESDIR